MKLPISGLSAILVRIAIAGMIAAPYWYWSGRLSNWKQLNSSSSASTTEVSYKSVRSTNERSRHVPVPRIQLLFDYLDAKAFAAMLSADTAVFIPASAIAASLLTVLVFTVSVRSYALPNDTSGLLLLIYLSNYVHLVSMGMFYRSAKPLLARLMMAATFLVLSALRDTSNNPARLRTGLWSGVLRDEPAR